MKDDDKYVSLLRSLEHELKCNILSTLETCSRELSIAIKGKPDRSRIETNIQPIIDATHRVKALLFYINYKDNPERCAKEVKTYDGTLHQIFYLAQQQLRKRLKDKNITCIITGESNRCPGYSSYITLLPFLLLDNAIKYAPRYSAVKVHLTELESKTCIKISSLGPIVTKEEEPNIFSEGFRSQEAIKTTQDGGGVGLYMAKCICDLNNCKITAKSDGYLIDFGQNKYSEFEVYMEFEYT